MPIKLKSTGGGSVTLDVPSTGTDYTLYVPANNATLISSNGASLSNTTLSGNSVLTGNVAISGASSYLNINGSNISQYSGMMKNRIINGAMAIDQRFSGAANNNTSNFQYVVDRWYHVGAAPSRFRSQQNNTNGPGSSATQTATGFPNYFGANTITANASYGAADAYYYSQPIEGLNIADLGWGTANAQPVTLSFWVYSSIPGTHSGSLANSLATRSYPFTYTINAANTWQYQTITVPGDTTGQWYTNTSIGMYVIYNMGTGSTYTTSTGNSWQGAYYQYVTGTNQVQSYANGSFYLTGVQLEKGLQATAFDFRHYGTELQLCQRYYQYLSMPGQAYFSAINITTAYRRYQIFYPVTMRAAPTGSFGNIAGNAAAGVLTQISTNAMEVGATADAGTYVYWNTNGYVTASAELVIQN